MFTSKRSNRFCCLSYFDNSVKRHKVSAGSKTTFAALKFLRRFNPQPSEKDREVEHLSPGDRHDAVGVISIRVVAD